MWSPSAPFAVPASRRVGARRSPRPAAEAGAHGAPAEGSGRLGRFAHAGATIRIAAALAIAALSAGCFQPLYAERSWTGGASVRDALAAVDIAQIEAPHGSALARIAVEVRNELLFGVTGGAGGAPPTHRLQIRLVPSQTAVIIDRTTGRPEFENLGLDATFTLTEIATRKNVMTGSAIARVSYDIPGQQQRFAKQRGLRDAETQAARLIAEQIKSRLASYFLART